MKVQNSSNLHPLIVNHLHWLIPGGPPAELGKSDLASVRLRAAPSMMTARRMGWRVTYGETILGMPSIIVLGKIGVTNIEMRETLWIDQIRKVKDTAKLFLDYTDHHLGFDSPMSNFYELALREVNGCIVPSKSMSELLSSRWKGSISIIEDPLEVDARQPKIRAEVPITLLWFGHSSNIDFLIHFLSTGFVDGDHIRLIVLSNEVGLNHFANSKFASNANIQVNLALWSLDNMAEAAKVSDMCIIPSNLSDSRKVGASSNRLITALTLGLPTAADNLPSYKEFESYYCDLRGDGFREMLKNPAKFTSIVTRAQIDLIPRFCMSRIEDAWKIFFSNLNS